MRMYLSFTPTSMQFMPISPRPPMGRTLSGGPSSEGGPGNGLLARKSRAEPRCSLPSLALYCLIFTPVSDTKKSQGSVKLMYFAARACFSCRADGQCLEGEACNSNSTAGAWDMIIIMARRKLN
jgi:hypothetical protein